MTEQEETDFGPLAGLIGDNSLIYEQTTLLDIYGRQFDHTDRSELSQR